MRIRTLTAATALAAGATVGLAAPAAAQPPDQSGLVNVNISDLDVQIPIGIAANICDVDVAVLVQDLLDDAAQCDAVATPNAVITRPADDGAPGTQEGLVNVNVSNIAIQAPIGVVANVCDVNVAVLVSGLVDDSAPCTGSADPDSTITLV
ncbi:hypothetical protein GCM10027451_04470 [Geodermatophilus aquaeductus]|uniref:Small secreted domain n=1 Tax=Geodermatophilus aquaeductus TaxID=1564161 RepID=A0A521CBT3_9ACTN|nr:hypothetical protein [Geodermatophilus aquaeductus]SMO56220.1 hypothetical protein SAMN06273567_102230 [Geodermatophilus aquaeductus]